jgi:hypothetical protein
MIILFLVTLTRLPQQENDFGRIEGEVDGEGVVYLRVKCASADDATISSWSVIQTFQKRQNRTLLKKFSQAMMRYNFIKLKNELNLSAQSLVTHFDSFRIHLQIEAINVSDKRRNE